MIDNSQNLSNVPSRFKPFSFHEIRFATDRSCDFHKRCYKHIQNLKIYVETHPKTLFKRISMPKTLHSLNIHTRLYALKLSLVKKIVKPLKKSLRSISRNVDYQEIRKLLPLLYKLKVRMTPDSFRILSFHSDLKKLRFKFNEEEQRKISGEELLMKNKTRLSRIFAKIKSLKSMSMVMENKQVNSANLMLEIIDQNLPLKSLKKLSLKNFMGDISSEGPPFEHKKSISNIISKITHLYTDIPAWYSFLISSGKLESLSVLTLALESKISPCVSRDLFQFHNLPKLREFNLTVALHSESSELSFFESFSLPESLEYLSLTFRNFTLLQISDNLALSRDFSERLQGKGVKTLYLWIAENTTNLALIAKFYCLFIKCFHHLETLQCKNLKDRSEAEAKDKPLDFKEFWTSLQPSKETLETLYINVREVTFPEDISILECEFPRLQKLYLKDSVSSGAEFGRFCQRIPILKDVVVRGMKFTDEEKLVKCLNDMKEVSEEGSFELNLTVGKIKQEALTGWLKRCLQTGKAKGKVRIYLYDVQVEDPQGQKYKEFLNMVKEQQCFYSCQIVSTFRPIFKIKKSLFD